MKKAHMSSESNIKIIKDSVVDGTVIPLTRQSPLI